MKTFTISTRITSYNVCYTKLLRDKRLARERGIEVSSYTPEKLAQVRERIGAANQIILADQFRWTALLSRLEALLPVDVAIQSLRPDYSKRSLQLNLIARDTAAMTELLDTMLNSEDMSRVFLSRQTRITSYNVCYTKLLRSIMGR